MLTSIRIQNFRSIRDAEVKLGQVTLFIGPNNSGKSNYLKGISLFALGVREYPRNPLPFDKFITVHSRYINQNTWLQPIHWIAQSTEFSSKSVSLIIGNDYDVLNEERPIYTSEISVLPSNQIKHQFTGYYDLPYDEDEQSIAGEVRALQEVFERVFVFKIEPSRFNFSVPLKNEVSFSSNGNNIVNFIYNLSQNHKKIFLQLEKDFGRCVGSLISVSVPADPDVQGNLKLKFFDKDDVGYWAEEVSEGVLYFLALLCLVHQPNPPKILLLEEPEQGIHPRRIKEVMDFIFELARLRNIQIILTSHSPYIVDHFADIPECISVFDRIDGETVVRNAADIIQKTNEEYAAQDLPPIKYTDSLGEYWVSGFLGGVPL